jgi:hypothetical protein
MCQVISSASQYNVILPEILIIDIELVNWRVILCSVVTLADFTNPVEDFSIFRLWAYLMMVIPETRRVHYNRYLRFFYYHWIDTSASVLSPPSISSLSRSSKTLFRTFRLLAPKWFLNYFAFEYFNYERI